MAVLAPLAADRCSRTDPRVLKTAVERRLKTLIPNTFGVGELGEALCYSLLARGKRIRPLMTVLASWELGVEGLAALDAGCALEMIHTASLILDDLPAMDDARERRGQAAAHVRFGEDVAILAAIALLNQAYATVAGMRASPEARCAMVAVLTRAVGLGGLAGGQYADLRPMRLAPLSGDVARANDLKTGALFTAAIDLAAIVSGCDEGASRGLRRCAGEIGQAFQLLDDLADAVGPDGGGRAEDDGKPTLPALLGVHEARFRLRQHVQAALAGLRSDGALAGFVRSIFEGDLVREPAE